MVVATVSGVTVSGISIYFLINDHKSAQWAIINPTLKPQFEPVCLASPHTLKDGHQTPVASGKIMDG